VRYSHVIDPRTGKALTHHDAATVIARAGMMADAYATAVTVLDETQRTRFIAAHPEARFYLRNPTARSPS
jgi:thiamine biosynthesis lipoprotein